MQILETYTYKDIKDYVSVVEEYNEGEFRLFRGQSCDGPLLPKIARKNPKQDTTEKEKKMLEELRRRANLFIGNKMDNWDLMVYAQHFGMATRLLDWTSILWPLFGLHAATPKRTLLVMCIFWKFPLIYS